MKKKLLLSILSGLLCFFMLVGCTFDVFTGNNASVNTIIASEALDVELCWSTDGTTWNKIDSSSSIFSDGLWNPGNTQIRYLKVKNTGSVAFKYALTFTEVSAFSNLAQVIDLYYLAGQTHLTQEDVSSSMTYAGALNEMKNVPLLSGTLLAEQSEVYTVALKMREEAGDAYNGLDLGTLGIQFSAMEYASETNTVPPTPSPTTSTEEYLEQQLRTALSGKTLSILGDSISTYTGYSNNTSYNSTIGDNAVWYDGSQNGFTTVSETWWMQIINRTGIILNVNNSWSGDQVTKRGLSRSLQLHNTTGDVPNIIAVYIGINDFRWGKTVAQFEEKYDEMIAGIIDKYENADVYLFTLVYTSNVKSPDVAPENVVAFNAVIEQVAEKYDCTLVDLYNDTGINKSNLSAYMVDGTLHPNYAGMDCITECFMDALIDNYITQ